MANVNESNGSDNSIETIVPSDRSRDFCGDSKDRSSAAVPEGDNRLIGGQRKMRAGMRHLLLSMCSTIVIAVPTLGLPQSAFAGDNKAYPGSMCDAENGALEIFKNSATISNGSSTATRTVTCPFVRDNTKATNGTDGALLVFVEREAFNNDPLSCEFQTTVPETGATESRFSAQFTGVGRARLEIQIPRTAPVIGAYTMLCQLPPRSSIHAYAVPER
ncbi:MAG: hypothetical protein R3F54_23205 [Alphaproteobacteria bacterium]